jgi:predicted HD phosphohydrolase
MTTSDDGHDAANGTHSPLLQEGWRYVGAIALDDFSRADFALLDAQRRPFYRDRQALEVLRMLKASEHDPTFGYRINNYRHCLQSATMARRAGKDDEYVAVALLHDIGFIACPSVHGAFAATLLAPYISEDNRWMLVHHAIFQNLHSTAHPDLDSQGREKWRGHPAFERTAEFVARFDQAAMDPDYDNMPIEAFEGVVRDLFARTPRPLPDLP